MWKKAHVSKFQLFSTGLGQIPGELGTVACNLSSLIIYPPFDKANGTPVL